jgi:hypothetical protein
VLLLRTCCVSRTFERPCWVATVWVQRVLWLIFASLAACTMCTYEQHQLVFSSTVLQLGVGGHAASRTWVDVAAAVAVVYVCYTSDSRRPATSAASLGCGCVQHVLCVIPRAPPSGWCQAAEQRQWHVPLRTAQPAM